MFIEMVNNRFRGEKKKVNEFGERATMNCCSFTGIKLIKYADYKMKQ